MEMGVSLKSEILGKSSRGQQLAQLIIYTHKKKKRGGGRQDRGDTKKKKKKGEEEEEEEQGEARGWITSGQHHVQPATSPRPPSPPHRRRCSPDRIAPIPANHQTDPNSTSH
jgi:hypothetical protein